MIPGLTDHEMPAILAAAAEAGARFAGYTPLRLPLGVAPLFEDWLERQMPAGARNGSSAASAPSAAAGSTSRGSARGCRAKVRSPR